jgi:hypothetical protein
MVRVVRKDLDVTGDSAPGRQIGPRPCVMRRDAQRFARLHLVDLALQAHGESPKGKIRSNPLQNL